MVIDACAFGGLTVGDNIAQQKKIHKEKISLTVYKDSTPGLAVCVCVGFQKASFL